MVALDFALAGSNGDSIVFDGANGFYLTSGVRGLGIPSTDVRITNSAGDGGTWRSTRRGVREIDLPVVVLGDDRGDIEAKLRRLASALSDRYGVPKLIANYTDGTSYEIEVHYTGGAETQFGTDAGSQFCRWAITVQAPDPYWTSTQAVSFALTQSSGGRGLLPELQKLQVESSSLLGSFTVENVGDVDAFPVWTIEGPITDAAITLGSVGFTYENAMSTGDVITIDTKAATITDGAGVNMYGFLGAAPKLFAFPPGASNISVVVTGSDADTKVSGYYRPRREVIH